MPTGIGGEEGWRRRRQRAGREGEIAVLRSVVPVLRSVVLCSVVFVLRSVDLLRTFVLCSLDFVLRSVDVLRTFVLCSVVFVLRSADSLRTFVLCSLDFVLRSVDVLCSAASLPGSTSKAMVSASDFSVASTVEAGSFSKAARSWMNFRIVGTSGRDCVSV
jgi:hypothetical protein